MAYLVLKALHVVFVISWFAGLFYLPRIFVNLAMVPNEPAHKLENDRLLLMANKLFRFMTPLGVLAVVLASGFGLATTSAQARDGCMPKPCWCLP